MKNKEISNILSIDFGSKKCGFAIYRGLALSVPIPLETLFYKTEKDLIDHIESSLESEEIDLLVFGLPLNSQGEETPMCKKIRHFAKVLGDNLSISLPMAFQDESLSSFSAYEEIKGKGKKSLKNLDSHAAVTILRDYLQS